VDYARKKWESSLLQVDDRLMMVRSAKEATTLVGLVKSIFEIRKAVEPVDFLGTEI
jgi:hypothetical protein